ncbi:MAG: hypothetical protein LBR55_03560, partial [Bacteroidales bacterium]|nr:hypothetical protein [Bacteroidales bacterium]
MKTMKFFIRILLVSLMYIVGLNATQAQTCSTTVGGSDFDAAPTAADDYRNINSTAQLGPSGNKIGTSLGMMTQTTTVGTDPF